MKITPNSYGSILMEMNDCHEPAGKPTGGQFCSKGGLSKSKDPQYKKAYRTEYRARARADVESDAAKSVAGKSDEAIRRPRMLWVVEQTAKEYSYGLPKGARARYEQAFVAAWQARYRALTGGDLTNAGDTMRDAAPSYGGATPDPPKLSGWGTPVEKIDSYSDRMADLRPQVQKGDLVIGQRYVPPTPDKPYGVMMTEFGKALRVLKGEVILLRPDGTKTRIGSKIAVYRKSDERASAEAVWQHYEKYGIPGRER